MKKHLFLSSLLLLVCSTAMAHPRVRHVLYEVHGQETISIWETAEQGKEAKYEIDRCDANFENCVSLVPGIPEIAQWALNEQVGVAGFPTKYDPTPDPKMPKMSLYRRKLLRNALTPAGNADWLMPDNKLVWSVDSYEKTLTMALDAASKEVKRAGGAQ